MKACKVSLSLISRKFLFLLNLKNEYERNEKIQIKKIKIKKTKRKGMWKKEKLKNLTVYCTTYYYQYIHTYIPTIPKWERKAKTRLSFGLVKNVLQLLHIHRTTNTHRHKHICIHPKYTLRTRPHICALPVTARILQSFDALIK